MGIKELGPLKLEGTLPTGGLGEPILDSPALTLGASPEPAPPNPSPPLPLQAETGLPPQERILGLPCVISPWFAGASGTPGAAGTQRIERGRGKRAGCPQGRLRLREGRLAQAQHVGGRTSWALRQKGPQSALWPRFLSFK